MGFPNLVLPFDTALIDALSGYVLAVRSGDPSAVAGVAEYVRSSANRLSMVILDSPVPLNEIPFDESWKGIRLAVFAPKMGPFRALAERLRQIRDINPTVYLSVDNPENLTALRILSSINVRCAAVFGDPGSVDWEALTDLATYAVAGLVAHGPIEPFSTIASRYRSDGWIEWGSIFFDGPADFLHLDERGRIALSHRELLEENFIETDVGRLTGVTGSAPYRERIDAVRRLFLDYDPCTRCPGWRLCLGRFAPSGDDRNACAAFTAEMTALLDDLGNRPNGNGKERHDHRHL